MSKRLYNTFEFIGSMVIPNPLVYHDTKLKRQSLRLGVRDEEANSTGFINFDHWVNNENKPIKYLFSTDGEQMEVAWNDRLNPVILNGVADFKKINIDLETDFEKKTEYTEAFFRMLHENKKETPDPEKIKECKEILSDTPNRHQVLTELDAISILKESLPQYAETHKIKIKGDVALSESKGKIYINYRPRSFELMPLETPSNLSLTLDIFFDENSVDITPLEDSKVIPVQGYVLDYDKNSSNKSKISYYPLNNMVINARNLNLEDDKTSKILNYMVGKFNTEPNMVHHNQFEVFLFNGADKIDVDDDSSFELTPDQEMEIELGISTIDDFKPKGTVYGSNYTELRIVKPITKGQFSDGSISVCSQDDFYQSIVKMGDNTTVEDVIKNANETKATDDVVSVDDLLEGLK